MDSTLAFLPGCGIVLCSQKRGVSLEVESRAWNPVLHNCFSSVETWLLFFYKTIGVIVPVISLLEHLPRNWRHEFHPFLRDVQICFSPAGESILIARARRACSKGANPLAKAMIICRMKHEIIQSEKSQGKENLELGCSRAMILVVWSLFLQLLVWIFGRRTWAILAHVPSVGN